MDGWMDGWNGMECVASVGKVGLKVLKGSGEHVHRVFKASKVPFGTLETAFMPPRFNLRFSSVGAKENVRSISAH